jgi:hypothetical protein
MAASAFTELQCVYRVLSVRFSNDWLAVAGDVAGFQNDQHVIAGVPATVWGVSRGIRHELVRLSVSTLLATAEE